MAGSKIHIYESPGTLSKNLASRILNLIQKTVNNGKDFNIAVSGGKTPVLLFQNMAKNRKFINWNYVRFYWVDERCVPPEHADSNFRMVNDALLKNIDVSEQNIFRIRGEDDPVSEAERYSNLIRRNVPSDNFWPCFDLIILGMGSDGHTASIFPGHLELFSSECICENTIHPETRQQRITLTGNVINNARNIYLLITGKEKSIIISHLFDTRQNTRQYPVSHVRPVNGLLEWFIDSEAGRYIIKNPS